MNILKLIVTISILTSCASLNKRFGFEDDNVVEEMIEDSLEDTFGIEIDLTPGN